MSSGIRIGWMSAPEFLTHRLELHMQATQIHTSGISQAIVYALLAKWVRS